jgi:nucleoside 2-deoxyribosyltransferase
MQTCFVIQPFDSGKFDKRFKETFAPAITTAGFEPYRVDDDPRADVLITSIEDGIRSAAVCLADITTDNPNVWFELGFAFAANRPVVMVCSNERTGKYPFDIQHRAVVAYKTEAQSDFKALSDAITERLQAAAERGQTLQLIAEEGPVAPVSGLSQIELTILAVAAGAALPGSGFSLWSLQNDAEKLGLSKIGISLALRRLMQKQFLEDARIEDQNGDLKGLRSALKDGIGSMLMKTISRSAVPQRTTENSTGPKSATTIFRFERNPWTRLSCERSEPIART